MKQKHNMKPMAKSHHSVTSKLLLVILALFTFIGGMKAQAVTGEITFELTDSYGDGWNGATIRVVDLSSNNTVLGTFTNTDAAKKDEAQIYTLSVTHGHEIRFLWNSGSYDSECSYVVKDKFGDIIFSGSGAMSAPVTYTMNCYRSPQNVRATNIGTTDVSLTWEGSADSYVMRYRTAGVWHQVGNDVITDKVLKQYTFDLSGYSGTGSIAIRHYNVTDMFRLMVDDIVVKDALGNNLFSEGFESGVIPSNMKNIDLDGDSYIWKIGHFVDDNNNNIQNGDYCVYSESWVSGVGAVTPDNWLIIPNVELGGTLTFYARGIDDSYPQENIGVLVTTVPTGEWVEESSINTSFQLTGLDVNTLYEWQVKGIYGTESSNWSSASFSTITEDYKIFVTDGAWNVADNWSPAGVPEETDEVSIEANVTIPSGVVAVANRASINGGSITIEDGAQLKQGAVTLKVTMKKDITGYGTGAGHYNLISSPFTGITSIGYKENWNYILNLAEGTYDLYSFDFTEGDEWINYKSSPDNRLFFIESTNVHGLEYGYGYLYANQEDKTIQFIGTTQSSLNNSMLIDATYDATAPFKGWALVGNPFTCNSTISFVDNSETPLNATFYKMNAAGNGFDAYADYVVLTPGEGAFIHYTQSGKIQYSSEVSGTPNNAVVENLPVLPLQGLDINQDANLIDVALYDNESNFTTLESNNGKRANVTLQGRKLWKDGEWNTICLPFSIGNFSGTPLEGATVMEFAGNTSAFNETNGELTLNFANATTIDAGKSYIVKWDATTPNYMENPVFAGVTINSAYIETVNSSDNKVNFTGTYGPLTYDTEDKSVLFLGSGSTLYYPEAGASINAFRSFFQLNGLTAGDPTDSSTPVKSFVLNFGEDTETGIFDVRSKTEDGRGDGVIYNIAGQRLNKLQRGINIVNGHKIVIK